MEASWAGGGILSPLPPWEAMPALWELVAESLAAYPALCAELHAESGIDPEWWRCGMEIRGSDLAAAVAWCSERGLACETRPAQGGTVWLPWVTQLRNPRFCRALSRVLASQGVVLRDECGTVRLETKAGLVEACHARGRQSAEVIIVAAGAWSAELLAPTNWDIPVWPVKGEMLALRPERPGLDRIVVSAGHYLVPRRDGTVLVGSTLQDSGFDKSVDANTRDRLRSIAAGLHDGLRDAPCVAHWAGLRPGSPDGLPIIAKHPKLPNLYANTGHFRYGLTLAPASAQRLLGLLC